jgi:hypothetical protein
LGITREKCTKDKGHETHEAIVCQGEPVLRRHGTEVPGSEIRV